MDFIDKIVAFFKGEQVEIILGFVFITVEYWLGKTTMVKPNSTLEVVLSGIKKVLEFLKIKKPS